MQAKRATGQGAASRKYDMLTAVGALACGESSTLQRSALRFLTVVTARYNWAMDDLSMGRAEMARLWQVDERTVKRELAKLKGRGWISVKRPAARGRVTCYSIDWTTILKETRPVWERIGPDFVARMGGFADPVPAPPPDNLVAFPAPSGGPDADDPWSAARSAIHAEDPAFFASWCAALKTSSVEGGVLTLATPSAFHAQYLAAHAQERLLRAVARATPDIRRLCFEAVPL